MMRVFIVLLCWWPAYLQATVLSDAITACSTVNQYCELTALAGNIPLDLVDSGNGHNLLEYTAKGVWSQRDGKLMFFGGGHQSTPAIITYTESTNTWTKTNQSFVNPAQHAYSNNTANQFVGRWYYKDYGSCTSIRRFSIANNTEATSAATHSWGTSTCYSGLEYFPDIGKVIFASQENGNNWGVMAFEDSLSGAGTWSRIGPSPGTYNTGFADGQIVYNPVHRVVLFGSNLQTVWKIDASLSVTQLASAPCSMEVTNPTFNIFTVDPVSGHYLLLCGDGTTRQLDITAGTSGTWSTAVSSVPAFFGATGAINGWFGVIAVPMPGHGGVLFLECGGVSNCRSGSKPRVWFLRHMTSTVYDVKRQQAGILFAEDFARAKDRIYYADTGIDSVNCGSALQAAGLQHGFSFNQTHAGPGNAFPTGAGGCHWPAADTSVRHFSSGSLKLTTPNVGASNTTGNWEGGLIRRGDGSFVYIAPSGPWGNTLWIQYYFRADLSFTGLSSTCTGGCYGVKHLLSQGNAPNGVDSGLDSITTVFYESGTSPTTLTMIPTMYGQVGVDDSYYATGGSSTLIGPQPVVNCTFALPGQCIRLNPNQWYEFTYQYIINPPSYYAGAGGAGCSAPSQPASTVRLWIDGVKVIDNPCASVVYGTPTSGDGVGTLSFSNYHTNATSHTPGGGQTTANTWTTEFLMSTSPICMVGQACTGGVPNLNQPAAPTNVFVSQLGRQ